MEGGVDSLKHLKKYKDQFKAVEVSTMALAYWWSFVLAIPGSTFDDTPAYSAMDRLAPEYAWSIFMFIVGTFQLVGMIKNSYLLKRIGLLLATGTWFFVATMFLLGSYTNTGIGSYGIIALLCSWLYVKVGGQHGR